MARPGRFIRAGATSKCVCEGTPPPIEIWLADELIVLPPVTDVDAITVTGPAVLPLWRIVEAMPFTVDAVAA
jgi:hypothetical protein